MKLKDSKYSNNQSLQFDLKKFKTSVLYPDSYIKIVRAGAGLNKNKVDIINDFIDNNHAVTNYKTRYWQ